MQSTRREFLIDLSFAAAAVAFPRNLAPSEMPLAFSTLGCPKWDLSQILTFARSHGFAAVELRGLVANMDLPSQAAVSASQIGETKLQFAKDNIKIACVSSYARIGEEYAAKRPKDIYDAKRFVDLAAALGSHYIRVLGDR